MSALSSPDSRSGLPSDGRLPGLDVLRGIAALCVLHFHAFGILHPELKIDGKGYLAVDFFFMLSGYVMARTYEQRFAKGYAATTFVASRFRRFWPVMAIGALLGAPMAWIELRDPAIFFAVALTNIMLVPSFVAGAAFPLNGAAWSIFAELLANFAHGLCIWRWKTRRLVVLLVLAVPALVWSGIELGNLGSGLLGSVARAMVAYIGGIVLWRWWQDRPTLNVLPGVAFAAMPVVTLASQALHIESWLFDLAFLLVLCPMLIAGGLRHTGQHWLSHWLGMLSFPLYAIHLPIIHWTKGLGIGATAGIAIALILATLIALRTGAAPRAAATLAKA